MKLPPKLEAFAKFLDEQPPNAQEAFQFLLATTMQEAGKFELVGVSEVDGRTHYTFRSTAGDVFSIVRPEISKGVEKEVREELRKILREEGLV